MADIEIRRAADRARTTTDWLSSSHSFAFGPHYDPANVGFGPLIALNCDVVQPGPGYVTHRHAGVEILSWVTAGLLEHSTRVEHSTRDSTSLVGPGQLQYLSTGAGIAHAERSGSATEPVTVIQLWLQGRLDAESIYEVGQIPAEQWVLAASARRPAPVRLRHVEAELYVGRLPAGAAIELPDAAKLHVFVVRGRVELDGQALAVQDEARLSRPVGLIATAEAEILVWVFA